MRMRCAAVRTRHSVINGWRLPGVRHPAASLLAIACETLSSAVCSIGSEATSGRSPSNIDKHLPAACRKSSQPLTSVIFPGHIPGYFYIIKINRHVHLFIHREVDSAINDIHLLFIHYSQCAGQIYQHGSGPDHQRHVDASRLVDDLGKGAVRGGVRS